MTRRTLGVAVAACLLAGALISAPTGAAAATGYDMKFQQHIVKTRHGQIYVEVGVPIKNNKMVRGPAVLTYSPYSVLGRNQDAERYVSRGYARVWADVLGTGNSGGCYDYGGKRETQSGHDLVEWVAKQEWSTGKVAMIGGSYDGATAIGTATTAPRHLTTIVPEAAPSSWYDYAYSGGIRYSLNSEKPLEQALDTPAAFSAGLAIPPPTDPQNDAWADRLTSSMTPCDEAEHLTRGYSDTPDYDGFWKERDYVRDANKVNVPVLIGHNWGDWNVKPDHPYNLFKALRKTSRSPKVSLFMGHRYQGHTTPGGNYDAVKDAWLDHYLMGKNNGIQSLPPVTSQVSDYDGARGWHRGGVPNTKNVTLFAQLGIRATFDDYEWKLLPTKPIRGFLQGQAEFPTAGINAETHANHHGRSHHDWWWFESPMLKRDVRIFGEIKVQLYSKIARKWVTLTPTIVDIDIDCHETIGNQHSVRPECLPRATQSLTRGFLDSRYRKGLGKQVLFDPGKPFSATVVQKPQDHVFKKGHVIALNVQTEINDWMVVKPYPGCDSAEQATTDCSTFETLWQEGRTRVILPVVNAPKNPQSLFEPPGHDHGGDDDEICIGSTCIDSPVNLTGLRK